MCVSTGWEWKLVKVHARETDRERERVRKIDSEIEVARDEGDVRRERIGKGVEGRERLCVYV